LFAPCFVSEAVRKLSAAVQILFLSSSVLINNVQTFRETHNSSYIAFKLQTACRVGAKRTRSGAKEATPTSGFASGLLPTATSASYGINNDSNDSSLFIANERIK